MQRTYDEVEVRAIAMGALLDHRTVRKFLRGERVRPMTKARIERALREVERGEGAKGARRGRS
jgi:hypothetical protein